MTAGVVVALVALLVAGVSDSDDGDAVPAGLIADRA
jgi:hypothetical protein